MFIQLSPNNHIGSHTTIHQAQSKQNWGAGRDIMAKAIEQDGRRQAKKNGDVKKSNNKIGAAPSPSLIRLAPTNHNKNHMTINQARADKAGVWQQEEWKATILVPLSQSKENGDIK